MKNQTKLLVSILLLLFSITVDAQLDTLNYVKQFEINKANYINKPLSVLLDDMTEIQPKTIWARPNFKNKHITMHSAVNFCDKQFSFFNEINLVIQWETPLSRENTKYYEQLNDYYFTNDERLFYGSKIVKDIRVYRH